MTTSSMPLRGGRNFTTLTFSGHDARRRAEAWLLIHGFRFGPPEPALGRRAVVYGDRILGGRLPVWSGLCDLALKEIDGCIRDRGKDVEVEIFADATPEAVDIALGRNIERVAA